MNVLVVDDEPSIRKLVSGLLNRAGFTTVEAGNAEEALSRAPDELDLLLTDVLMPGAHGPELADRLRRRLPNLPVLYMSGFNHYSRSELKGSRCLEKPFGSKALIDAVRQAISDANLAIASAGRETVPDQLCAAAEKARHEWVGSVRALRDLSVEAPPGLPRPNGALPNEDGAKKTR